MQFEARLMGLKKTRNKDGDWCECRLEVHPNEAQDLFMLALGTRLGVAAVEITDDEQPATPEKLKGGELARQAGILIKNIKMQAFMAGHHDPEDHLHVVDPPSRPVNPLEADCRWQICKQCNIRNLRELDHNPEAAERFKTLKAEFEQAHGLMAERTR